MLLMYPSGLSGRSSRSSRRKTGSGSSSSSSSGRVFVERCTTIWFCCRLLFMILIFMTSRPSSSSSNNHCSHGGGRVLVVSAFEFQHDENPDQCQKDVKQCTKNTSMWYKCPISCSKHFEREGSMAEERDDPEQFFNLNVETTSRGSDGPAYSMENNEGYITLFAVLPLLRGVSQYYYDAIEHMSHVYKYTLVPIVFPYRTDQATMALISQAQNSRTKVLLSGPSSSDDNPNMNTLKYLLTRTIVAGNNEDLELATDRPTIFLISHDGMFIERLIAPTMETIERRIKVYEQAMNMEPKDL
jgi:hypothetical protein